MVPTGYTLLFLFPDGSQRMVDYVGQIPQEGDPHTWRWHVACVEPGGILNGQRVDYVVRLVDAPSGRHSSEPPKRFSGPAWGTKRVLDGEEIAERNSVGSDPEDRPG